MVMKWGEEGRAIIKCKKGVRKNHLGKTKLSENTYKTR
jgi:hypothetical protein